MKNPSNGINLICFTGIDQDAIQVNNNKYIELFYQYLINVSLESFWYVRETQ